MNPSEHRPIQLHGVNVASRKHLRPHAECVADVRGRPRRWIARCSRATEVHADHDHVTCNGFVVRSGYYFRTKVKECCGERTPSGWKWMDIGAQRGQAPEELPGVCPDATPHGNGAAAQIRSPLEVAIHPTYSPFLAAGIQRASVVQGHLGGTDLRLTAEDRRGAAWSG